MRRARAGDLDEVVRLVGEHAAYERSAAPAAGLAARLDGLLFGSGAPRLRCFVAELGSGEIVGYATCAPEVSTWDGAEYLHMDCLFLRDGHRGLGLGPRLVEAVVEEAQALGCDHVQWQTPAWNEDAVRFYERIGARATEKLRFKLPVG